MDRDGVGRGLGWGGMEDKGLSKVLGDGDLGGADGGARAWAQCYGARFRDGWDGAGCRVLSPHCGDPTQWCPHPRARTTPLLSPKDTQ